MCGCFVVVVVVVVVAFLAILVTEFCPLGENCFCCLAVIMMVLCCGGVLLPFPLISLIISTSETWQTRTYNYLTEDDVEIRPCNLCEIDAE